MRTQKTLYTNTIRANKTKDGRKIEITDRAEAATDYIEFDIWNNAEPKHNTKGEIHKRKT